MPEPCSHPAIQETLLAAIPTPCGDFPAPSVFPTRKPDWVRRTVLELHEHTGHSHRQLAHLFNRLYYARTGVSVGRTWVRETLKHQAYQALQKQQQCKHRIPAALPNNACWSMDMTYLQTHPVFGLIDSGSRLNLVLRILPRFNRWTLLGAVFLAIGRYGKPGVIKLDNHPVHHARLVKKILRLTGIRLRFIQPASPWQNGRIERYFGTLKSAMHGLTFPDATGLRLALAEYRAFYNDVRPHQHLHGKTPSETWAHIDPYRRSPRSVAWYEGGGGRWRGWRLYH